MTEAKKDTTKDDKPTATGADSPDVQAAADAGLTEGDIKALRDDAGLNGLAGHGANLAVWEQSEAGKKFVKEAKDTKEAEAAAKKSAESLDKDGVSEAEKKYLEAVNK